MRRSDDRACESRSGAWARGMRRHDGCVCGSRSGAIPKIPRGMYIDRRVDKGVTDERERFRRLTGFIAMVRRRGRFPDCAYRCR